MKDIPCKYTFHFIYSPIKYIYMALIRIQVALFFLQDCKDNYEQISLSLKEKFGSSIRTYQIPIDDQGPSEIPRLTLIYPEYQINVAKNRLDFILNKKANNNNELDLINKLFSVNYSNLKIDFKRLGVAKTSFEEQPIKNIINLLKNPYCDKDFAEMQLRVNEKFEIMGIPCNNIEQLNFGKVKKQDSQEETEGIIILRDVNTSLERIEKIDITDLRSLYDKLSLKSEGRILK